MAKKDKQDPKLKTVTKKVAKKKTAVKKTATAKATAAKKVVKVVKKKVLKKVARKKATSKAENLTDELPFGDDVASAVVHSQGNPASGEATQADATEVVDQEPKTTSTSKAPSKSKSKSSSAKPKSRKSPRPAVAEEIAAEENGEVAIGEVAIGEVAIGEVAIGEVAIGEVAVDTADSASAEDSTESSTPSAETDSSSRKRNRRGPRDRRRRGGADSADGGGGDGRRDRSDSREAEADGASQVGGSEEESDAVACESDREGRASSHSGSGGADASPAVEVEPKSEPEPEPEPDPGPPPPERIDLAEFQQRTVAELYELGTSLNLRVGGISSKHDLIFEILSYWGKRGTKIDAEGVLEVTSDGYGFLRWPAFNFTPHADDVYISANIIRDHGLQTGNLVKVLARAPQNREKFLSVESVMFVEGIPSGNWERPQAFDKLTALSPRERLVLEDPVRRSVSPRAVDIIAPLGKGQRGVIVAPPRGGKTILLKEMAGAISRNHPEATVIVLLLDERPEEVTDFEESAVASVYSSTFDEPPERHVQVAELVAERAKRLVEIGKDVVILMDSLTRLARGYNGLTKGKGKTGSGGIDHGALQKARRLFNIARNTEEGGSLTLIATALIDTGSRMDDVIFEEFKGSGNMEVELDRDLLERRIFPAINIQKSGTRKDDLLYHPDEFKRIGMIRRQLAQLPGGEAMEKLIHNIENTKSNAELLLAGLK